MADHGPLVFRRVSGRAIDPSSVEVPVVCIALFGEDGHRLIATTLADEKGKFELSRIALGKYRLGAR